MRVYLQLHGPTDDPEAVKALLARSFLTDPHGTIAIGKHRLVIDGKRVMVFSAAIDTDDPEALLIEFRPPTERCPEPLAVVTELASGWTTCTSKPIEITAYAKLVQTTAEARAAYRPLAEFLDPDAASDYNGLRRILQEHPQVRSRRPVSTKTGQAIGNRQIVHAGHMLEAIAQVKVGQRREERRQQKEKQRREEHERLVKDALAAAAAQKKAAEQRQRDAH
jgi:hypothetical protein